MAEVRIGTSGYDYLDWRGTFYPAHVGRDEFLSYYSGHFSTLELNFSYYRMPEKKQLAAILRRSEGRVDFSIKAHESLTHRIDAHSWRDAVKQYRGALDPLQEDEKLAAVLLQFPFSFHYTPENRRYLNALLEEMRELPLAVEFRNTEWVSKRVITALQERRVAFCSVDTPRLRGLPPPVDIVTSDLAYIRFHGRNEKNWWGSDAAARFDYLYNDEELSAWIDRIMVMMNGARQVRVYFNNHRRGQAPANAQMLTSLLARQGIAVR